LGVETRNWKAEYLRGACNTTEMIYAVDLGTLTWLLNKQELRTTCRTSCEMLFARSWYVHCNVDNESSGEYVKDSSDATIYVNNVNGSNALPFTESNSSNSSLVLSNLMLLLLLQQME
jgi:hypothetical protein